MMIEAGELDCQRRGEIVKAMLLTLSIVSERARGWEIVPVWYYALEFDADVYIV